MTAYDPFDPAVIDDPYPYYARLREESPVARVERLDLWVLSRHADVLGALRDPAIQPTTGTETPTAVMPTPTKAKPTFFGSPLTTPLKIEKTV